MSKIQTEKLHNVTASHLTNQKHFLSSKSVAHIYEIFCHESWAFLTHTKNWHRLLTQEYKQGILTDIELVHVNLRCNVKVLY